MSEEDSDFIVCIAERVIAGAADDSSSRTDARSSAFFLVKQLKEIEHHETAIVACHRSWHGGDRSGDVTRSGREHHHHQRDLRGRVQVHQLRSARIGDQCGAGTNINGISNTGTVAGVAIDNGGNLTNFTANPPISTVANPLNINGSTAAMALGVNSAGTVVGTDGNGNAFSLPNGGSVNTFIPNGGTSAMAFGINDHGTIVGQYTTAGGTSPGFMLNGKIVNHNQRPHWRFVERRQCSGHQ